MKALLFVIVLTIVVLAVLIVTSLRYEIAVKEIWRSLKSKSTDTVFTPAMIADLPEPVQKYFCHALTPGTPLPDYVELEMSGDFRLKPNGRWMPMKASQIITTSGDFIWKAKIGKGIVSFSGADYFHHGKGRIRFSWWGLIPLVNAGNENITRSSIGRLAVEYGMWLPSALLPQNGVTWQAISPKARHCVIAQNTIQASLKLNNEPINLTLAINADGQLLKLSLPRWGESTEQNNWHYIPFGAEVKAEQTFGEYTIPSVIDAGWWFGKQNYFEFFRPRIEQAKFA